jgi:uncharacterized protein (DUF1501 family)
MAVSVDNHSSVVPLRPQTVGGFAASLKEIAPLLPGDELTSFIRGRMVANAVGHGRMAMGASLMAAGLDAAPHVHRQLAQIRPSRRQDNPEKQTLAMIAQCFRLSISRSAIYVTTEMFDVHAAEQAKGQPKLFSTAISKIATLLKGLADTPFDNTRSMFDVTTIMVASEFSRTMRTDEDPIDNTGTNHNQLANSILIGGKGIRSGLVVGASDLADGSMAASPAHRSMDPALMKAMGRPFDFETMQPRPDLPEAFDIADYLTVGSVINTVYSLFGVPKEHHRSPSRELPPSPVLSGLLA